MENNISKYALAGLLHDVNLFYEKTSVKNNSTKNFIINELHRNVSDFLLDEVTDGCRLSASISEGEDKTGKYENLHSILSLVDFGKEKTDSILPLSEADELRNEVTNKDNKYCSESDYDKLLRAIRTDISEGKYSSDNEMLNRLYSLFYKYLATVPFNRYVDLFSHMRMACAISSCYGYSNCRDNKKFYMLEFDVSGIQKFIYQIVEGGQNKKGLTKALRGRSALVGIITNSIAYGFLNEFDLTCANLLFNTGGGGLILLPYLDDTLERVDAVSKKMRRKLFELYQSDITFVEAAIEISSEELIYFESDKAVELKTALGQKKMKKFSDLINNDFFYRSTGSNDTCPLCGRLLVGGNCSICKDVEAVSDVYIHNDSFAMVYRYDDTVVSSNSIDLGYATVSFITDNKYIDDKYIDSINGFGYGNPRFIANMVPKDRNGQISLEKIVRLTPDIYGDHKLGILKMDVDNLGGIFAFGLLKNGKRQREITKFVAMSKLLEYFFGKKLKDICLAVSKEINPDIDKLTSNGNMFYINYAGGDDLVIAGSVYSIIVLSERIYYEFKEYVNNENITISAGIQIQGEAAPFRFGVLKAEEQLELSKSEDKNAVSLLDVRVPFAEYNGLLADVNEIIELIEENTVSRTAIYNLMSVMDDKTYQQYLALVPRIQYSLTRNVKANGLDGKKKLDFLKSITTISSNQKDLDLAVLKLKLVILMTRERDN